MCKNKFGSFKLNFFTFVKNKITMKPFNLEAALAGAKVVTRDGRKVKVSGYNPDAKNENAIIGWLDNLGYKWAEDGSAKYSPMSDLFMAPTERKEWIVRVVNSFDTIIELSRFHDLESAEFYANKSKGDERYFKVSVHEITIFE